MLLLKPIWSDQPTVAPLASRWRSCPNRRGVQLYATVTLVFIATRCAFSVSCIQQPAPLAGKVLVFACDRRRAYRAYATTYPECLGTDHPGPDLRMRLERQPQV